MIIACVLKTGVHNNQGVITEYTPDVVRWLKRQCEQFVTVPFKFVCLTNLDKIQGVDTIKLNHNFPNWWSKIELFRPDIFKGEKVFYMDLDTVIVGNIDHIVNYDHKMTTLSQMSVFHKDPTTHLIGSGLMAWGQDMSYIYKAFMKSPKKHMKENITCDNWGDQGFIQRTLKEPSERFQLLFPRQIVSYKADLKLKDPTRHNRIVVFHGKPKPMELAGKKSWVPKI